MTPLAPHITAFLRERLPLERGASLHTCETYAHAFRLLFEFAAVRLKTTPSQLHLEQIDVPLVLTFLDHLERERGNGAASRNNRLAAIKSFMHFVEYRVPSALEQIRRILAIPMKKTDTKLVRHLSMVEMQAILDAPDPKTRIGIRDRAMIHTCFVAGLRVSELVGLQVQNVSFDPRPCLRILGKGRRERLLPLWKQSGTVLRAWLAVRGSAAVPEMFLNTMGDVMTRAGFEYVLRRHVASARIVCPSLCRKKVSPHVLRHTCAMMTLQATGNIRKVALWLGHNNLQTTEMYLRADPTEKLEAINLTTPRSLRKGKFTAPDRLIELLRSGKRPEDYAEQSEGADLGHTEGKNSWIGPRRRLTLHNHVLR